MTNTKFVMTYVDTSGETRQMSYANVKEDMSGNVAKAICSAFVDYGALFKNPPAEVTGAKLVMTEEAEFDLG